MNKLTGLEKARLRLEAEKHVDGLSYSGLCVIAPRSMHWWQASSENSLYAMQRESAINITYDKLLKAAQE